MNTLTQDTSGLSYYFRNHDRRKDVLDIIIIFLSTVYDFVTAPRPDSEDEPKKMDKMKKEEERLAKAIKEKEEEQDRKDYEECFPLLAINV